MQISKRLLEASRGAIQSKLLPVLSARLPAFMESPELVFFASAISRTIFFVVLLTDPIDRTRTRVKLMVWLLSSKNRAMG